MRRTRGAGIPPEGTQEGLRRHADPSGRQSWRCRRIWLASILLGGLCSSCGVTNRFVAGAASGYLEAGALVFQQEPDVQLAAEAIPANFKLLEVILAKSPNDRKLLSLASQYIATYAYAFVEPAAEMRQFDAPDVALDARDRASALYLRGRDYGLRALAKKKAFQAGLDGTLEELEAGLATLDHRDLPALFWAAFCWGSYANLNLDDPEALADAGTISAMMRRALEIDERFFYGGPHLYFGVFLSQLPPSAGGDPARSREHFERAIEFSGGGLLMARVFFARYYAVRVQDWELWRSELEAVLSFDLETAPDERLANAIAQDRARFYLEHEDDFFLLKEG